MKEKVEISRHILNHRGYPPKMITKFHAFIWQLLKDPESCNWGNEIKIAKELYASFPEIKFDVSINSAKSSNIICDERLITQALTNIYKNGGESILRRFDEIGANNSKGKISTFVKYSDEHITISIFDNGTGWPVQDKERLLEPYVTTRESGTGLGLAIVMRIAEDHGGKLKLKYRTDNKPGALVEISLRKNAAENYIKTII